MNIAQSMEMKQSFDDLIYYSGATRKELELDGNTFLFYLPWRPSGDAGFIPAELNYFTAIIKREVG